MKPSTLYTTMRRYRISHAARKGRHAVLKAKCTTSETGYQFFPAVLALSQRSLLAIA